MKTVSVVVVGKPSITGAVSDAATEYHEKTSAIVRDARMRGSRDVDVSTSQSSGFVPGEGFYVHILGTVLWS